MRTAVRVEALLAHMPLFSGMTASELAPIAAGTVRRKLRRGEILFREGEKPRAIHFLVYGRIKLATSGRDGKERLIDTVTAGRSFGDAILFLDKPYIVSATALADSLVLEVAKEAIFSALEASPRFVRRVIGALAERVERLVRERDNYAVGSGAKRFVGWLVRRPELTAAAGTTSVVLPETKRLLAARLNVSAEHFSRILHELATEKLISVHGRRLVIPDPGRLRAWQLGSARPD